MTRNALCPGHEGIPGGPALVAMHARHFKEDTLTLDLIRFDGVLAKVPSAIWIIVHHLMLRRPQVGDRAVRGQRRVQDDGQAQVCGF